MTLSRLFKKQTERNVTHQGIDKVVRTRHQRTVRRLFGKQGTQRSEIGHSSCSVLFMLLENRKKLMLIPVSACAKKDERTFSSQVTYGATGALTI